jgi:hypothetical protein
MRGLNHPRAPHVVVAAALLLALPSLAIRFFADDYAFIDYLEHRVPYSPPWWDLYRFTPDHIAAIPRIFATGQMPWWTAPELHLHLVRPLPSALLALDHAVFGRAALGWHLHSFGWYAVLLLAAGIWFRRALPPAVATLALGIFALSNANTFPFAWLSARYCLLAGALVATGVMAHVRYRRDGWSTGRWLAPVALVLGLLAGEGALGGFAFAISYDLVGPSPNGTRARQRVARALPLVAVGLAYLVVYGCIGGGARGSAAYVSPLSEPKAFLVAASTRFPVLLADALLGIPAEFSSLGAGRALIFLGLLATVGFVVLWKACAPLIPEDERKTARWLALGALASVATGVGGFPGSRELLVANLGFAPIFAMVLRYGFAPGRFALVRRVGAGVLALTHLGVAPLDQLVNQYSMHSMARATEGVARAIVREAKGSARMFLVAASDPMASMYAPAIVASEADEASRARGCFVWLSGARADLTITRTGQASFALEPRGMTLLQGSFETLFRATWLPIEAGYEVSVCDARVRVVSVEKGRPSRIEVTSRADLEGNDATWLVWEAGELRRFVFPAVGASRTVAWTTGPSGVF